METPSTADKLRDLETGQWFIVLSNAVFLFPAVMALHKDEYIRFLGFLTITVVSAMYHSCRDADLCEYKAYMWRLDHTFSVWLAVTIVLLFSSLPRFVEWPLEIVLLGVVMIVYFTATDHEDHDTDLAIDLVVPGVVALFVVPLSWWWKGFIEALWFYVALGLAFVLTGLIIFFAEPISDEFVAHGLWHTFVGFGAGLLIIGLRDTEARQHQQYVLV